MVVLAGLHESHRSSKDLLRKQIRSRGQNSGRAQNFTGFLQRLAAGPVPDCANQIASAHRKSTTSSSKGRKVALDSSAIEVKRQEKVNALRSLARCEIE